MDDQSPSEENFRFSYSLDRSNYFRRACPKCGLEFKTKADPSEIGSMLQPIFSKVGLEIGNNPNNKDDEEIHNNLMTCPYCGERSESNGFFTQVFVQYLKKYIHREVLLPRFNKVLQDFAENVGHKRGGQKGFFSFEISMEFNREIYPPHPISGPEPPDMKIIEMICCNTEIKLLEKWSCEIYCPYCSKKEILI